MATEKQASGKREASIRKERKHASDGRVTAPFQTQTGKGWRSEQKVAFASATFLCVKKEGMKMWFW